MGELDGKVIPVKLMEARIGISKVLNELVKLESELREDSMRVEVSKLIDLVNPAYEALHESLKLDWSQRK